MDLFSSITIILSNYSRDLSFLFDLKNVKVENKLIDQFNETFDTILYLSVLEHIENDKKEILNSLEKLEDKGHLIICVPAYNYMYSNFDKEIGHFRRYEMDFFDTLNLKNAAVKKSFFIDSFGFLLLIPPSTDTCS